jgi:hypothetical protein
MGKDAAPNRVPALVHALAGKEVRQVREIPGLGFTLRCCGLDIY